MLSQQLSRHKQMFALKIPANHEDVKLVHFTGWSHKPRAQNETFKIFVLFNQQSKSHKY